ncbi:strawberry notch C-terminal domain-containing protein [Leptolyngbya sp. PCC 6406]|uniref:strawberry notch C-terminal domain-containing protein n=1 Tax=Leptolyngbya sp. PCC 6406 TaxID=1173264 RepID=UPI0002AC6081|nr:strawberry notch C-terminal domain-containing protein [Leptolyngbya sp. PCC 6406]
MGSFIDNYAKDNDLNPGDEVEANFSDILTRYLERSRDVVETDYDGTQTRRRLTDEELGPQAVEAFDRAKELIQETNLSFPVSPIDTIKQKVEAAGYTFGEITGRTARLDYSGNGNPTYERRSSYETSKAAKVEMTDSFNSGRTDVLLLNRSGSTGISLHASEKFTDQRQRHMIVGQAERNVNDFMQTLGRAHRTGQVVPPKISLLMGDTPDEKRPAALLERKMSSLNANTIADKNAGFDTSEIPDFFNQYGDAVVEQLLSEYPEINAKLDYPITVSPEGVGSVEEATEGAIAKVTGRLPLLTVKEQEAFYNALESEYTSFVDQQKALGNNVLEAEAVDLDARSLAQAQVIPRKDGVSSAFGSGVSVEIMDVKAQSHAKTQLEVINEVRDNLGLDAVDAVEAHDSAAVDEVSQGYSTQLLEKATQAAEVYLAEQSAQARRKTADPEQQQSMINRATKRLDRQKTQLTQLNRLRLGQTVRLDTGSGRIFYGAVSSITKRGESLETTLSKGAQSEASDDADSLGATNPVAPSKWEINVSLADSARELPLPLSKVNTKGMGSVDLTPVKKTLLGKGVMAQFDERQTGQREVRQAFRGNLLRAAEKYGRQGSVINATVSGGGVEPMLMLPQGYDVQRDIQEAPVTLPAARNIRQFMEITDNQGIVKTADEQITLKAAPNDENFLLQTGKKQKDVFLDEGLMQTIGDEFYSVSDRMEVMIPADRLGEVAHYIQAGRNQQLEATTHLDQARELVGDKLPEFSWSASVDEVVEQAGIAPAVDLSNLDAVREGLETVLQQETDPTGTAEEVSSDSNPSAHDAFEASPVPPQPSGADLAAKVQQAKDLANDGMMMTFQVDVDLNTPDLETNLDIGADGQPRFDLFDPDDIRLENGTAQVQVGVDASGETLADVWAEIPHAETQLETAIAQAQPLRAALEAKFQGVALEAEPEPEPEPEPEAARIGGWKAQSGRPEKQVGKLLEAAGLSEAIMADDEFYLKVENQPFIPLSIERQDNRLMLYHTLVENGDAYLDSEMVFNLSEEGSLALAETAVHGPRGEVRGLDRSYANMFAKNLRAQGFAEAAQRQQQSTRTSADTKAARTETASPVTPASEPNQEAQGPTVREPEPLDYRQTLDSLRATADALPERSRATLLSAIQQADAQLNGEATPESPELMPDARGGNEVLQAAIAQQDPELNDQMVQGAGTGVPSVEEFRDWYRKASVMGKSEAVLGQIANAGRQAKVGTLPADGYDADAMQAHLQGYDHQAAIAADIMPNADRFLASAQAAGIVQETTTGAIAEGKTYRVTLAEGEMSIHNKQTGGKLAFREDGITSVQGMTEADRDRWQRLGQKSADELKHQIAQRQQRRQPSLSRLSQPEPEMA